MGVFLKVFMLEIKEKNEENTKKMSCSLLLFVNI